MRRALFALLVLAACGQPETETPYVTVPKFRDPSVLIASTTRGAPTDLNGEWVISASFVGSYFNSVAPAGGGVIVDVDPSGTGRWTFRNAEGRTTSVPVWQRMTGRFQQGWPGDASSTPGSPIEGTAREFWVLWVDDDFRTAAVGTPDGSLGWIMNRPGEASGDRTAAAREVLEWSGYDLGRLGSGV